jgi:hypothetical protein
MPWRLDYSAEWATPEKSDNNVTQAATHVHGASFCRFRNLWIMLASCANARRHPVLFFILSAPARFVQAWRLSKYALIIAEDKT